MHISKMTLVNYRNFSNTTLKFQRGVNTIIGENGSGKSNILRAIRLLLDDTMVRASYRLEESDFCRSLGEWRGHWIIISVEFEDISADEAVQALFLHGTAALEGGPLAKATYNLIFRPKKEIRLKLAALDVFDDEELKEIRNTITIDDYETVFTGRSSADFSDPSVYQSLVGDFDTCIFSAETEFPEVGAKVPGFLSVTKEVSLTFIQALRDVVAEFHNNRTNPLFALLKSKSGEIDPVSMLPITEMVRDLNASIEGLEDVQSVRNHIRETIKDAAGETYSPASLSIKSDLPDEAEKLFQSLRLFVGEADDGYEGGIHELSLGGANLIYLTLKLLEFKYQREKLAIANFLLIEEPEAHIHTHIQKTLFDRISYSDAQVIYTTHSTHISEVSNVSNVNILGRQGLNCEAYQPATGLEPSEVRSIQRYLDAVRSNLLFAKSVVLVEGDAEEILIPILVKKVLGLSVDELGISVINIRSTGFKNVAVLFNDLRIRKRCAIVTDLDTTFFDVAPQPADSEALANRKRKAIGSQKAGGERKVDLDAFIAGNPWLSVFYAPRTFEVELVLAGNREAFVQTVNSVYKAPQTITEAVNDLRSIQPHLVSFRALLMAEYAGKGWFAIMLAEELDHQVAVPPYILQAIHFAHGHISAPLLARILQYRVARQIEVDPSTQPRLALFGVELDRYQRGDIDLVGLKAAVALALPNDAIGSFMAGIA
ncbi:MAG: AAA family ATPase [Gammaproteobacteria bacterium]|uniref:AAA family ATPase n=1 Tax=Pseudomonas TaxID=286 RepID=UPI00098AD3FC|nr:MULTISPECIES: AAA family ATPase [Pseudomonas]MBU0523641.1 AAA family ATPase [Gammaproteobacteria bacterium]MBS4086656.1 AAA family ATPase [Pseudomonas rustica]MBU0820919.1 AAA family ATPase [Gammaproteobacteria bacterium]MBU0844662.1 AAA family ATPase [Gammaproteobacteria bacterium]MBU1842966.1 AAA family ATPase [Gammaproteobacteria bacterium]